MVTQDGTNKTYLSLSEAALKQSTNQLQTILANSMFMYQLYKKYHWHVNGTDFYPYHLLFDKHADELLPLVDLIAERLRSIGSTADAMPQDIIDNSSIKEQALNSLEAQAKVQNLLVAHEQYIAVVRKAVEICNKNKDEATSDLLVSDVLRVHELQVWFLRSSLAQ